MSVNIFYQVTFPNLSWKRSSLDIENIKWCDTFHDLMTLIYELDGVKLMPDVASLGYVHCEGTARLPRLVGLKMAIDMMLVLFFFSCFQIYSRDVLCVRRESNIVWNLTSFHTLFLRTLWRSLMKIWVLRTEFETDIIRGCKGGRPDWCSCISGGTCTGCTEMGIRYSLRKTPMAKVTCSYRPIGLQGGVSGIDQPSKGNGKEELPECATSFLNAGCSGGRHH